MGWYARSVLPKLLASAMRQKDLVPFRSRIGRAATGRVLELGIGPALNLPFYGPDVTAVIGIEPSRAFLDMAAEGARGAAVPCRLLAARGDALPIENGSIDTVVTTWTLCTVPDAAAVLAEVRRVLRPGGKLLFAEHGRSPEPSVSRWQDRLNPVWLHLAGGCNINRPMPALIERAGFSVSDLSTGYVGRPKVATFMFSGVGTPR